MYSRATPSSAAKSDRKCPDPSPAQRKLDLIRSESINCRSTYCWIAHAKAQLAQVDQVLITIEHVVIHVRAIDVQLAQVHHRCNAREGLRRECLTAVHVKTRQILQARGVSVVLHAANCSSKHTLESCPQRGQSASSSRTSAAARDWALTAPPFQS